MTAPQPPIAPREPEIEALTRAARAALFVLRIVIATAGLVALAYGTLRLLGVPDVLGTLLEPYGIPSVPDPKRVAQHFVWFCPGLILVLPAERLFGRWRLWVLAVSALLWFVPIMLAGDHTYGFVLRMFGTLAACLTMLVWRTLWRLSEAASESHKGPR